MAESRKALLAFCSLAMGMTMLSRVFNFYYVKVFLHKYNIHESWFHLSQILYMVWNAVNDPLFAILQDNTKCILTRTRREGILYTAPLYALSFLVPWFQFGDSPWAVGLHLIVALFLWDTMFTFTGLLSCCLFTELSADVNVRLQLTRYAQVASLIGAQSVFLVEYASDSLHNFFAFQMVAVVLAFVSCIFMIYTGLHAHTQYDPSPQKIHQEVKAKDTFFKQMWQLFLERNFLSFVATNFCQEFHLSFLRSFTAIICEYLVPTDQVPASVRGLFYGMTGTLGKVLVIFGTPIVGRLGYARIIRYSFVWKVLGGLTMFFFIGASNPWLIMLFILLETSFAGGTFSLFNMPLSDIADDDKMKYQRSKPISSTVFGSNALVVKPAQSLSPMLVVSILNRYGYEQLKLVGGSGTAAELEGMKAVMFQLICFIPMLTGLAQLITWAQFTIKHHPNTSSDKHTVSKSI